MYITYICLHVNTYTHMHKYRERKRQLEKTRMAIFSMAAPSLLVMAAEMRGIVGSTPPKQPTTKCSILPSSTWGTSMALRSVGASLQSCVQLSPPYSVILGVAACLNPNVPQSKSEGRKPYLRIVTGLSNRYRSGLGLKKTRYMHMYI